MADLAEIDGWMGGWMDGWMGGDCGHFSSKWAAAASRPSSSVTWGISRSFTMFYGGVHAPENWEVGK